MFTPKDFSEIENDPEFKALKASDPQKANELVRFMARKAVQGGLRSKSPEIKTFFERNLSPVAGYRGGGLEAAKSIIKESGKSGLGTTLTGSVGMAALGVPRAEPIDVAGAYRQLLSGEFRPSVGEYLTGLGAAQASILGAAADLPLELGGARILKGPTQRIMGAAAPVAATLGSGLFGAGQAGGVAYFSGATPSEIKAQAGIGYLGGTLGGMLPYVAGRPKGVTAQELQAARTKARMAKKPSPGLSPNLMPPAAQTMRGGPTGRPFRPDVERPTGRIPVSEATLVEPATALVPTRPVRPRGPETAGSAAPLGPSSFAPSAIEGQAISADMASAAYQSTRQAREAAERELDALLASGQRLDPTSSRIVDREARLTAARVEQLRQEEQRLAAVAGDLMAAREQAAARMAAQEQMRGFVGTAYEAPPPARGGMLPPPSPTGGPAGLAAPPGTPLTWEFPATPRGFSEAALYGTPSPPIVPPAPQARPQLPPPSGPEIIPPRGAAPPAALVEQFGVPALEGMAGQRPPGIPAGYVSGLLPPPSFIPAGAGQAFAGEAQQGLRPPGMPGQFMQAPQPVPPPPMMPPSRQLQPPSGAMVPPAADIPGAPRYVGGAPVRGAEEALMGQIGTRQALPSTRQELEAIASAAANERFALQQQLNALALPEKATKAQIAQRNATEMQLREGIIAAGERQMEALRRLGSLPPEASAPRTTPAVEPPAAPAPGKKKAQTDLADTPLGRLLLGEEGMATPEGAVGALVAPVATALGGLYRGMLAGAGAARRGLASSQFRQLAEIPRLIPAGANAVGKYVSDNMPPTLRNAIAAVQGAPGASATGLYNFVAARSPNTARTLDAMGRFFITNYGKPAAYLELEEAAAQAGRQIQNNLANFGIKVFDTVGDNAARMRRLHADMTAETYVPGSNRVDDALVLEGRRLTSQVGAHLVRVGALTPEAYAKWGGRYLPRIYQKFLIAGKDGEATSAFMRMFDDDPTLSGYYHRGIKETVSQAEATKRAATGEWEIIPKSQKSNGDVDVWRDFTEAERNAFGEVRNVAVALGKYAKQASAEIKNGTFLEGIRTGKDSNGAWAIDASTQYKNPRQRPTEFTTSSGQRYVYVGDAARKGGSIKKFGTLSDHYVRDDIYQHLRFQAEFGGFKQITRGVKKYTGINLFKKLVTIGNPAYFANNFMVNIPQLVLGGGAVSDIPLAASLITAQDKLVTDLAARGVIQDGLALRQLSQRINPILKQAGTGAAHSPGMVSVALDRAASALARYESVGYGFANASDDLFRVALVKGLMDRQKMTFDQAVEVAKTTFYNREAVTAPFVDVMEAAQIPFYGVTHWTLGTLPKMVWENPAKAAYLATVAYLGTTVPEMLYGVEPEVAEARRKLLPAPMQGRLGLGFPNAVFVGYDAYNQPIYQDVGTWNPATGATAEVPIGPAQSFPRALSPGGPLTAAAQLAANYDFYTGKEIVPIEGGQRTAIDETLLSQIPGVGTYAPQEVRAFLGRSFIPGIVRQPYEAVREGIAQSLPPETAVSLGLTGGEAVPVSVMTRLGRAAGIKARPINMLEMFARNEGIKERKLSELRRSQAATYRRYERAANAGNEAEAEAALQKWNAYNLMIQSVEMEEAGKQMETLPALE